MPKRLISHRTRCGPGARPMVTPEMVTRCLEGSEGPCVIASDYVKALPESIGQLQNLKLLQLNRAS